MPCQWYVRGGGEGKLRILIGQSIPPTLFGMAFGRLKLSPLVSTAFVTIVASVAKGPKFRPQSTKGAAKILWGRENLGPNFLQIYQKRAEKGPIAIKIFLYYFAL
jgi:hypothetical protein